jgi:helicase
LIRGRYDIALLTYEKFAALALTHPHVLAQAGVIVVDEAQMIADPTRGANLEFIMTLVRMRRREGVEPQVVTLSAVIGETGGLESWLGGRLLRRNERPVPLAEGLLRADGSFRHLDPATGEERVEPGVVQRQYKKKGLLEIEWVILGFRWAGACRRGLLGGDIPRLSGRMRVAETLGSILLLSPSTKPSETLFSGLQ